MLTTSHILLGAAAFGKKDRPARTVGALLGGVVPDATIFVMFFWAVITGHSQQEIWNDVYFQPFWQELKSPFNSFFVYGAILALGLWLQRGWLWAFAASCLLHTFIDFLTHHDDGHAHFWPVSDWRFESPVSYWDPSHFGRQFSYFEIAATIAVSVFLWVRIPNWWMRALLALAWVGGIGTYLFFTLTLGGD